MSGLNPNLPGLGPGFGRDRSRSILMMNSKYDEDNEEDADSPVQVVKLGYTHFSAVLIVFRSTVIIPIKRGAYFQFSDKNVS